MLQFNATDNASRNYRGAFFLCLATVLLQFATVLLQIGSRSAYMRARMRMCASVGAGVRMCACVNILYIL